MPNGNDDPDPRQRLQSIFEDDEDGPTFDTDPSGDGAQVGPAAPPDQERRDFDRDPRERIAEITADLADADEEAIEEGGSLVSPEVARSAAEGLFRAVTRVGELQDEDQDVGIGGQMLRDLGRGTLELGAHLAELPGQLGTEGMQQMGQDLADFLQGEADDIPADDVAMAFRERMRRRREETTDRVPLDPFGILTMAAPDEDSPFGELLDDAEALTPDRQLTEIEQFGAELFDDPDGATQFAAMLAAESAPSLLATVGAGVASAPLGPLAQGGALLLTGGAMSSGQQLADAARDPESGKRRELDSREKLIALGSGMGAGAVEILGAAKITGSIQRMLRQSRLSEAQQAAAEREIGRRLQFVGGEVLATGSVEGTANALAGVIRDVGAQQGWDPDRAIGDGWFEDFLAGAILGGASGLATGTATATLEGARDAEATTGRAAQARQDARAPESEEAKSDAERQEALEPFEANHPDFQVEGEPIEAADFEAVTGLLAESEPGTPAFEAAAQEVIARSQEETREVFGGPDQVPTRIGDTQVSELTDGQLESVLQQAQEGSDAFLAAQTEAQRRQAQRIGPVASEVAPTLTRIEELTARREEEGSLPAAEAQELQGLFEQIAFDTIRDQHALETVFQMENRGNAFRDALAEGRARIEERIDRGEVRRDELGVRREAPPEDVQQAIEAPTSATAPREADPADQARTPDEEAAATEDVGEGIPDTDQSTRELTDEQRTRVTELSARQSELAQEMLEAGADRRVEISQEITEIRAELEEILARGRSPDAAQLAANIELGRVRRVEPGATDAIGNVTMGNQVTTEQMKMQAGRADLARRREENPDPEGRPRRVDEWFDGSPQEYLQQVAVSSRSPQEIAMAYQTAVRQEQVVAGADPQAQAIEDWAPYKTKGPGSFNEIASSDHLTELPHLRLWYLARDGTPLDGAAQEIQSVTQIETTPQDIADYIIEQAENLSGSLSDRIAQRYREVTGGNLTARRLEEHLETIDQEAQQANRDHGSGIEAPFSPQRDLGSPESRAHVSDQVNLFQDDTRDQHSARIQVDPLRADGEQVQNLSDMVDELADALNTGVVVQDPGQGRSGVYYPGNGAIAVRNYNDLQVVAHEIGHNLDDRHGLVAPWAEDATSPFDSELIPHFSQYGSEPPTKTPDGRNVVDGAEEGQVDTRVYERAEAVAEWIRAYIVNPEAAMEAAPRFAQHFVEQVPDADHRAIENFGEQIRMWAGLDAPERTLSNIRMTPQERSLWARLREQFRREPRDAIRRAATGGAFFGLGGFALGGPIGGGIGMLGGASLGTMWSTRLSAEVFDSLAPFFQAVETAKRIKGVEELLPLEDPYILTRLHAGFDLRFERVMQDGMIDFETKFLLDENGRPINPDAPEQSGAPRGGFDRIFEPLDTSSEQALNNDVERLVALMVNERVVEKARQWEGYAETIEQAPEQIANLEQQNEAAREQIAEIEERLARLREQGRQDGSISRAEAQIRELRSQIREREGAIEDVRADVQRARDALDYDGSPANVRDFVDQRLQRMTGTGAGIYSDTEQAFQAVDQIRQNEAQYQRLKEAAARLRQWHNDVLRYARDAGRISDEAYQRILENNQQYVALQRMVDEDAPAGVTSSARRLAASSEVVHKFGGSTREIRNPIQQAIQSTYQIMHEADRNQILKQFTQLLEADRSLYGDHPNLLRLHEIAVPSEAGQPRTIKVYRDGEAQHWQITDENVHQALNNWFDRSDSGIVETVLQFLPRVMHDSITHSPAFLIRNPTRDTTQRAVLSRTGNKPWDVFQMLGRSAAQAARGEQTEVQKLKADFERYGGGLFGYYRNTRDGYYQRLRDVMHQHVGDTANIITTPGRMVRAWSNFAQNSELVGRLSEFETALEQAREAGYDPANARAEAAFQARDITDYAQAGRAVRQINRYLIFTNAATQALLRAYNGLADNPAGFATRWFAYIGAIEVATLLWNLNVGDREEWMDQPAYLKDMFWGFKIGDDQWLRVPRPWEMGVASSLISRSFDFAMGDENAFEGWGQSMFRAITPVDENALFGPVQAFGQAILGYDLFRNRFIVPPWEQNKDLDLREGTSRASRLGQIMQDVVGVDARTMDFLVESQFGGTGRVATAASDLGRDDPDAPADPERRLRDEFFGVFATSPAWAAQDVQFVMDWARRRGQFNNDAIQRMNNMISAYFEAESAAERDELAQDLREFATRLRQRIEAAEAERQMREETPTP